jgi:hypothetical protein
MMGIGCVNVMTRPVIQVVAHRTVLEDFQVTLRPDTAALSLRAKSPSLRAKRSTLHPWAQGACRVAPLLTLTDGGVRANSPAERHAVHLTADHETE